MGRYKKYFILLLMIAFAAGNASAWTNEGGGDHGGSNWSPSDGTYIAGVHTNIGKFSVQSGVTVYISTAVELEVHARQVTVAGTIDGNELGYAGGMFGMGALASMFPAGGGNGGTNGGGVGAAGSTYDEGGGGGGAGGYGGAGQSGGAGGSSGGSGGSAGSSRGTTGNMTIDMGSGAGGGGGGGAGGGNGYSGVTGERGGGSIYLNSSGSMTITGVITANGGDGGQGGNAYSASEGAGGGGGGASGGGILLVSDDILNVEGSTITADGGDGGLTGSVGLAGTQGGGAGGGRIKFFYVTDKSTAGAVLSAAGGSGSSSGGDGTIYYGVIVDERFENNSGYDMVGWTETTGTGVTVDEDEATIGGDPSNWGDEYLEIICNGDENAYTTYNNLGSLSVSYFRFEIILPNIASASYIDTEPFVVVTDNSSSNVFWLYLVDEDMAGFSVNIRSYHDGSSNNYACLTNITENTRHRIEVKWDAVNNVWAWRIDDVDQRNDQDTSAPIESEGTISGGPTDTDNLSIGFIEKGVSSVQYDINMDNIAVEVSTWIGAANQNPDDPSSLTQKRSDNQETIGWGTYTGNTTPVLGFDLSDSDSGDQVKFQIQVSTKSDFTPNTTDFTSILMTQDTTSFTCPVLSAATYYWRVKCIDEYGLESSWVTANSGAEAFMVDTGGGDTEAPVAVSNLTALTSTAVGKITLKWTAPGDDGTDGTVQAYILKYSSSGIIKSADFNSADTYTQSWGSLQSGTNPETRTVDSLLEGVTYWFALKAYDDWNNYSVWNSSADVSTVNTLAHARAGYKAPSAVTCLSALAGTNAGEVTIKWTAPGKDGTVGSNTSEAYYTLKFATYSITSIGGNTTSWWNKAFEYFQTWPVQGYGYSEDKSLTLTPGVTYYFAVKTTDDAGITSNIDTLAGGAGQAWVLSPDLPFVVYPSSQHGSDDTIETNINEIKYEDSGGGWGPDPGTTSDGWYTVSYPNGNTIMYLNNFDISSVPRHTVSISSITLRCKYSAEDNGYNGTNSVRYDNSGGLSNTTITPGATADTVATDTTMKSSYNIDTWGEVERLDIEFTNNSSGGSKRTISFDYLWLEVYWKDDTAPNAITTLSALTGDNAEEIKLSWLAPGDDSTNYNNIAGSYYTVKYATFSVSGSTETWWNHSGVSEYTQSWPVATRNTTEDKVLDMPAADTEYWIAIKTTDAAGNESLIDGAYCPVSAVSKPDAAPPTSGLYRMFLMLD
jgi:hypothetical protein